MGTILDYEGVALCWNPALKARPEFYCFCDSQINTIKFFPYSKNILLGGLYNGQIVLWDLRAKNMPVMKSGSSKDSHIYPVSSLAVTGTQLANNLTSFSTDGEVCHWDLKNITSPLKSNKLNVPRSLKEAIRQGKLSTYKDKKNYSVQ